MNVEEIIRLRRTVRRFLPEPVSSAQIREMLALASHAPNIANRQMWRFIVITDGDLLRMLEGLVARHIQEMAGWGELINQPQRISALKEQALHFASAPAVIFVINQGYRSPLDVALVERGFKAWETAHLFGYPDLQSIGSVIAYLTLLAEERGFGTCWMTTPLVARKDLQASLELKPGEEIAALVAIGKPAEKPIPKGRRAIDEIIEWR